MRRLLVPFVVVLALLGCSDPSSSDDTATTTTAPADATAVELLSPGAEPTAPLRFTFTAGATLSFTSSTTVDQSVAGASPGPITTTFDITAEVTSVDDGVAHITATYANPQVQTEPTASPEIRAAAERTATILDGAVAQLQVDDRGNVEDAEFQVGGTDEAVGESVKAALLDNVSKVAAVVPTEAVGVGGRWVTRNTVDAEGITTTTEQTYTVLAIDATGADLTYTLTGTIAGASEGTISGSGTTRLSFDSLFAEVDGTSTTTMTAQGSDITQDVTQTLRRN